MPKVITGAEIRPGIVIMLAGDDAYNPIVAGRVEEFGSPLVFDNTVRVAIAGFPFLLSIRDTADVWDVSDLYADGPPVTVTLTHREARVLQTILNASFGGTVASFVGALVKRLQQVKVRQLQLWNASETAKKNGNVALYFSQQEATGYVGDPWDAIVPTSGTL